jgi:NADH-quinone oxidoreductase subunit N
MLLFMFSLTGIPPTAGFIGKFYLFTAAVSAGYTWLAVIAVVFSVVSAFFYLRVVMYMYMHEPEGEAPQLASSLSLGLALIVATLVVIGIGVYPSPFLDAASKLQSLLAVG